MQGGCFYREELYHIREKCKGVGGQQGTQKDKGGSRYFRKSNAQNSMYVVV